MDVGRIDNSVRLKFSEIIAADGTGIIASGRVKPGQTLVCQSITWRNRSGARGTATLQIRSGAVTYPIVDQLSPAANVFYGYASEIDIHEGEQVEISQESVLQSDVLDLIINGYIEQKTDFVR